MVLLVDEVSINFVRSLRDMLAGNSRSSIDMTVKWDGAMRFLLVLIQKMVNFLLQRNQFSIWIQNCTSQSQRLMQIIYLVHNSKFKVAFEEFSKLGIKDVLQGDLMFTDDVSTETIDGKSFYTFQPNTIVYAVDVNSDFGKKIKNAKIGVVWHTTYKGSALPDMKASFGANISGLQSPSTVWMDDATYKDVSGKATMTEKETQ